MITINKLTVSYQHEKPVLRSLELQLSPAHIHGIVGLNGAGKTTLLNTLYGLIKPDSGTVMFGTDKLNKKQVSYLVTENFFYSHITAREYLGLFQNNSFELEKWNLLFSLPLDAVIDSYSTGMKKKLAFLGVLKQDKPVMILDEPFNGLDIETCRIVRMVLLRFKEKGKTIIITSHIIETLTNLCDFIHYLDMGQIKYSKDKNGFRDFEKDVFEKIESENSDLIQNLVK